MTFRIPALAALFFMLCVGFTTQAMAASNSSDAAQNTALRDLHKLTILLDEASMAYEMYKIDMGNPLYKKAVDELVGKIRGLRGSFGGIAAKDDQQDSLQQIKEQVAIFLKKLNFNESRIAKGGYEDFRISGQMYSAKTKAQQAATSLYNTLIKDDSITVEAPVQKSRELATLFQTMASSYIEQTSSVFGTSTHTRGNKPLNELAVKFSDMLANFDIHTDKVLGLNTKVREVKNKWAFLKDSFINYKENTVPYLVYRYSTRMIQDLLDIGRMYETRNQTIAAPSLPSRSGANSGGTPLPPGVPARKP